MYFVPHSLFGLVGSNDCGLYAIAFATCIWTRSGCTQQDTMRQHLFQCFNRRELVPFQWWIYGGLGGQNPPSALEKCSVVAVAIEIVW